jgi:methionyl aminopeptidase
MSADLTKTPEQIQAMREGGKILATIFADLRAHVKPGMSEIEVNDWVEEQIEKHGAEPTYATLKPVFKGVICISVNEQIVHSPPSEYVLQTGDVVSFDMVITYKDMKVDSAFTMVIDEKLTGAKKLLLDTTEKSLYAGINAIKGDGTRIGDISAAVEVTLHGGQLGIIRELVGHGIGVEMHMPPEIPNFGTKGNGPVLKVGDTIAIEPMASLGGEKIKVDSDGWTISMKDSSLSAHFEHTVLITENGVEILTQL